MELFGKPVSARELTPREVRQLMSDASKRPHALDLMYPDGIPSDAISMSTGIPVESDDDACLEMLRQAEYEAVMEAVRDANPRYSAMIDRLAEALRKALARS